MTTVYQLGDGYTCAVCGEHGIVTTTETILMDEALDNFHPDQLDELEMVCENCYQAVMTWLRETRPEELREEAR